MDMLTRSKENQKEKTQSMTKVNGGRPFSIPTKSAQLRMEDILREAKEKYDQIMHA